MPLCIVRSIPAVLSCAELRFMPLIFTSTPALRKMSSSTLLSLPPPRIWGKTLPHREINPRASTSHHHVAVPCRCDIEQEIQDSPRNSSALYMRRFWAKLQAPGLPHPMTGHYKKRFGKGKSGAYRIFISAGPECRRPVGRDRPGKHKSVSFQTFHGPVIFRRHSKKKESKFA